MRSTEQAIPLPEMAALAAVVCFLTLRAPAADNAMCDDLVVRRPS
ncbi:hypothetical protein [Novosphingobium sp. P6W]|nr:hypothetical protein [Novosphingobium sp. P6W]